MPRVHGGRNHGLTRMDTNFYLQRMNEKQRRGVIVPLNHYRFAAVAARQPHFVSA